MEICADQIKNILLIDDDEDDCLLFNQAMSMVTKQISLTCLNCTDRLWEILEEYKPCLIVIDLHLPKRNGIEILQLIKTHPSYKDIQVIIWSTSSLEQNVLAAYNAGAQFFIEKPTDYKVFIATLHKIISKLSDDHRYDPVQISLVGTNVKL